MTAPEITIARDGVWTPWAAVLCRECEYVAIQEHQRVSQNIFARRLAVLEGAKRDAEIPRPDRALLGHCDTCHCRCWTRYDVALLQQVGLRAAELDWEGPFTWALQQTGGMCAALVFETEGREVVVTAMDGEIFLGEYPIPEDQYAERWIEHTRTWKSRSIYQDHVLLPVGDLEVLVDEGARKAIEFLRNPLQAVAS